MDDTIYNTPESDLDITETDKKPLSASEKLAQSRRDIEESSAIETLNLVWGLRLVADLIICTSALYMVYTASSEGQFQPLAAFIIVLVFFGAEIVFIIGYFKRKSWCVVPLHIYAGLSILNFPFGTILSILHYLNMHKVQFNKNV